MGSRAVEASGIQIRGGDWKIDGEARTRIECGWKGGNLEDPLVHDDDGDVEAPPLEDGEHRAQGAQAGRRLAAVLHLFHN